MAHKKNILALVLLGLLALGASAEKADAGKQAVIDADTLDASEVTQTTTLTGNVIVTKGTLLLKAEKAVVRESPEGDMYVTLTSSAGKPATFRQKRDGGPDLWVEGQAERIEYDERASIIKLFTGAQIRQLEGVRQTDDIKAEYISYDSLREVFAARNDASGESKSGKGRTRMIIAPRKPHQATPATPATGTP